MSDVVIAGHPGEIELPPLPGWSAHGGVTTTRRFKVRSGNVGTFVEAWRHNGAAGYQVIEDDGVWATVNVQFSDLQDGGVQSTMPDGQWSLTGSGLTAHIFEDDRFAALSSTHKDALNKLRSNPSFDDSYISYTSNGTNIRRLLVAQKDTFEPVAVVVTRRIQIAGNASVTMGWGNVGKVYEDTATWKAAEGVPDSITDELDGVALQWLVRPFSKEVQRNNTKVFTLTYWGAKQWDSWTYPNRV